ncbi:hypothetical protein H257_18028 [Aphanomyces astaci]|uniref:Uncharacterized protein n=1 Tax=Aphanomyces astaci TaxID=112090 RepID=W4FEA7_APHAT|nr:hypothetical protein H257_18028 [Aphanomyces astaci]ETV65214.1 hypothetical protein H257_18028 [Aphanomyces astaci]|eukprot:XP_009845338.1 hypothetical protein H257_18028 [Aphanomyces astaci]
MFYPSTLGIKTDNQAYKFEFPMKAGKIGKISKIPSAGFLYGIYHVRVESNGDKRIEKRFAFSKHDHYTHTSLNFVMNVYNKHHGVQESVPEEQTHQASSELYLGNTIIKSEHKIDSMDFSRDDTDDDAKYYLRDRINKANGDTFYKLVDKSKPYFKHQFRINPFLLSLCRRIMANLVLKNADRVIRIATDSITYNGSIELDSGSQFMFIKEDDKSSRGATIVGNSLKML